MTPRTEPFTAPAPLPGGAGDARRRELLQSVVEVARAIFGAAAGSVLLLDEERDELVFAAVSGEGEEFLVGRRFPAGSGIAGWVATSGEPVVVDDLTASRSFDRSVAESTEYVPDALMAAPWSATAGCWGSWRSWTRPPRPAPASPNSTCWPFSRARRPRPCGWSLPTPRQRFPRPAARTPCASSAAWNNSCANRPDLRPGTPAPGPPAR